MMTTKDFLEKLKEVFGRGNIEVGGRAREGALAAAEKGTSSEELWIESKRAFDRGEHNEGERLCLASRAAAWREREQEGRGGVSFPNEDARPPGPLFLGPLVELDSRTFFAELLEAVEKAGVKIVEDVRATLKETIDLLGYDAPPAPRSPIFSSPLANDPENTPEFRSLLAHYGQALYYGHGDWDGGWCVKKAVGILEKMTEGPSRQDQEAQVAPSPFPSSLPATPEAIAPSRNTRELRGELTELGGALSLEGRYADARAVVRAVNLLVIADEDARAVRERGDDFGTAAPMSAPPAHGGPEGLIEAKARELAGFGPLAWIQLAWIAYQLIQELKKCGKTPSEALDRSKKLGMMDSWRLKRLVRKSGYKGSHSSALDQVLAMVKAVSEAELTKMYGEVPDGE